MIRDRRMSRGLTQKELADLIGVSRTTVVMWETGRSLPTAEKLPKISTILRCTIDDLFLVKDCEIPHRVGRRHNQKTTL